jgi:hypothetical protein
MARSGEARGGRRLELGRGNLVRLRGDQLVLFSSKLQEFLRSSDVVMASQASSRKKGWRPMSEPDVYTPAKGSMCTRTSKAGAPVGLTGG